MSLSTPLYRSFLVKRLFLSTGLIVVVVLVVVVVVVLVVVGIVVVVVVVVVEVVVVEVVVVEVVVGTICSGILTGRTWLGSLELLGTLVIVNSPRKTTILNSTLYSY